MGAKPSEVDSEPRVWKDHVNVLYINLASRPDRDEQIRGELKKMCFSEKQIFKIYASVDEKDPFMGCTRSHKRALRRSYETGVFLTMVLEDDFRLDMVFSRAASMIRTWLAKLPNSDVLMLQCNPLRLTDSGVEGIRKVSAALSTAGYIVKSSYIPTMIDSMNHSLSRNKPLDLDFQRLQRRDQWHALQPPMGTQRASYSDIEKRFVNYGV